MKLSRIWGESSEEIAKRISFEELIRQQAMFELFPFEDTWMQTCWLIESMQSLVSKKSTPAHKMYPGDFYKEDVMKKTNRSRNMKRVADVINNQRE